MKYIFIICIFATGCGIQGSIKSASGDSNSATASGNAFANGGNSFGANSSIGNSDNFNIDLVTNAVPRLTITSNGSVGVGTSTPNQRFEVAGGDALINGLRLGVGANGDTTSTGFGFNVLNANTTGTWNTSIGYMALQSNTTGQSSTAVGYHSLMSSTTTQNTAVGAETARYTTAGFNTAIGTYVMLENTTGQYNTAVGHRSNQLNVTGSYNTLLGGRSLWNATAASNNTGAGYQVLAALTTGNNNLALGYNTAANITTGSNNLILGYSIDAPSATANNQLNIGNIIFGNNVDGLGSALSTGNIGIGTTNPQTKFQVAGVISGAADNTYTLGSASYRFSTIYATNSVINTSDRRQKRNIQSSDLGLDFINRLKPVSYSWKSGQDKSIHYGFIAQETEKILTEIKTVRGPHTAIVDHDMESDLYGIRYTEFIAPIVKALQELHSLFQTISLQMNDRFSFQDKQMNDLKNENRNLKLELEVQKKLLLQLNSRLDQIQSQK